MGLPRQPALINQRHNSTASGRGTLQRPRQARSQEKPWTQHGGSGGVTRPLLSLLLLHITLLTPQERWRPRRPRTFPLRARRGSGTLLPWPHTPAAAVASPQLLRGGHPRGLLPSIFVVLSEVRSYEVNSEALKGRWGGAKGTGAKGLCS